MISKQIPAMEWEVELVHLFVSEGHNFAGRHGKGALDHGVEDLDTVECVAGRGIRGDRYFNHKEGYKGQVTFFDQDVYEAVRERFDLPDLEASAFRRNILVRGVPLNDLIGRLFSLQGVEFEGVEEAKPCYWMDEACTEGVEEFLRGKGGLRARIKVGGELKRGRGVVRLLP